MTVTLDSPPAGAFLGGNTSRMSSDGIAMFDDVYVAGGAGTYRLRFETSALGGVSEQVVSSSSLLLSSLELSDTEVYEP